MTEFFKRKNTEFERMQPNRPLGETSNFIAEEMPRLIKEIKERKQKPEVLMEKISALVQNLNEKTISELISLSEYLKRTGITAVPFEGRLDQAIFDLKMLESVLVMHGFMPPQRLTELITVLCSNTQQLPGITYEDLIFINSPHDPRTFTDGEVGQSEFDFYQIHFRIEKKLEPIIRYMKEALVQLSQQPPKIQQAASLLDLSISLFPHVLKDLQAVGRSMPREHFDIFRPYLTGNALRNLKGPSGAFTAKVPVLDMLIGGENLDSKYLEYIAENHMYYPRDGRVQIASTYEKIQHGETLSALSEKLGNPPEIIERILKLVELMRSFRSHHYDAVKNQVPQALELTNNIGGTGGESDVAAFLKSRIQLQHVRDLKGMKKIIFENKKQQGK